ncbi:sugar ABC transporter ATP-binding protein [Candidatus Aerophobetes bacterium]|nr:sugar ABC transporter ATP-binding protein [Candidatus Aerophobetes bacterium]
MRSNNSEIILEMRNISKSFPGVKALSDVSLECKRGEVLCLVGENGAGKSTLMKILVGVYNQDEGEIILRGKKVDISNPWDAYRSGISIIYQESNLVPHLSVGENVLLGHEPSRGFIINPTKLYKSAKTWLQRLNIDINPRIPVYKLSVAQQQMIAIVKALSLNADLVIMDEPTSSLPLHEVETLFNCIRALKNEGRAIIYISHRLEEVFQIADRVAVLRDGKRVGVLSREGADKSTLVRMMIGREVEEVYPEKVKTFTVDKEILSVENLTSSTLKNINFKLYRGEILGVAGLMGSGRTALAKVIFGVDSPLDGGDIYFDGKSVSLKDPQRAIGAGIGFVSENRGEEGLVFTLSVTKNISLPILGKISYLKFWLNKNKEKKIARTLVEELKIRTPRLNTQVSYLSGGNQQKVVLAKWLSVAPKLIIFDEPTRGLDIGAKAEIHYLIRKMAENGTGVILISSEIPELMSLSDRILVMRKGQIVGELSSEEIAEHRILSLAAGEKED